ncbi:hypothetical protein CHUAL_008904 [Chamberlinius hualienensis]
MKQVGRSVAQTLKPTAMATNGTMRVDDVIHRLCIKGGGHHLDFLKNKHFVIYWLLSVVLIGCAFGDYAYKRPVTYAGPIVYSDEKPPVIQFPGPPPANSYNKPSSGYGGSGYGDTKSSITYVPLPLDDLPILIYQSKDKPPVHVLNRPSKDTYGGGGNTGYSSYASGSAANGPSSSSANYYAGNSYGTPPSSYGYSSGNSYTPSAASYGVGGSGSYGGGYMSSFGPSPVAPKPYYVGKPASPTVYLPQVKPNSYSYGAGNYGGYSGGSPYGGQTGNSYNGGSYSYNSAASPGSYSSGPSQSSYYSGPTKQQPPHIVYSGHPPIHVYQQPNPPPTTYSQTPSSYNSYGGNYNKPQSYANTYAAPPQPQPPKQQPNYVPAPPNYHKPPIIIYQGVKPPVHVYNEPSAPSSTYSASSTVGVGTGTYTGTSSATYGGGYSSKNGEQWEPVNTSVQEEEKRSPSEVKVVTFAAGDEEDQEVVVVPEQSLDIATEAEQSSQQKQETTS